MRHRLHFRDGWSPSPPTGYHYQHSRVGGAASNFCYAVIFYAF